MAQQKITGNEISTTQASITSNTQLASNVITSDKIVSVANTQIIGTTLPGPGQVNMIMLDSGSSSGNGAISIPRGNTAQRPSNPDIGMVRMNTDTGVLENYTSQGWLKVSVPIPIISSLSGSIYPGSNSSITINGSNFESTTGTISFQISGSSPVTVSATPNAGGTQVSCAVPSAIYSTVSGGTVVNVTYTNTDGGVSSPYSMTAVTLPSGGTTYSSNGYVYHKFTSSGNLVVPSSFSVSAEAIMVAGGGGGGNARGANWGAGGGGGAGGMIYTSLTLSSSTTYPIVIGAGGDGGVRGSTTNDAVSGSNTTFNGNTAVGGGRGGAAYFAGSSGGSGGGDGYYTNNTPASGTSGQGNSAGYVYQAQCGSGGGGKGAVGGNASVSNPRKGGDGGSGINTYSAWASATSSGSNGYYAGGGGGGIYTGDTSGVGTSGLGGAGGGGNAGAVATDSTTNNGNPGSTNTGGGGGGGSGYSVATQAGAGGQGGSGIVIIRYQLP